MLNSRRLKSKLPTTAELLQPRVALGARERLLAAPQKQEYYYDRQAKSLKGLELEEDVWVRENGYWVPAVVSDIWPAPRSCVVQTESGVTLRRNRRHLLKGAGTSSSVENDEEATTSGAVAPSSIRFELSSDQEEVHTTCLCLCSH